MNYSIETEKILLEEEGKGKTLLLHSCCAPCSSYVLKYLRKCFKITVFYYNPNITEEKEYRKRVEEQQRLINEMNAQFGYPISFLEGAYDPENYLETVRGMEELPEGGARCRVCFALRLKKTFEVAEQMQFDYFTTTLSISPLKSAEALNEIGLAVSMGGTTKYLLSDFKKKDGYKQSIELSKEYQLYRQDYCGCIFSEKERHGE